MRETMDAAAELVGAIGRLAPDLSLTLREVRTRPWAGSTFSGARHSVTFLAAASSIGEVSQHLPENLDGVDVPLHGHILADASVMAFEHRPGVFRVTVEALTVEDTP